MGSYVRRANIGPVTFQGVEEIKELTPQLQNNLTGVSRPYLWYGYGTFNTSTNQIANISGANRISPSSGTRTFSFGIWDSSAGYKFVAEMTYTESSSPPAVVANVTMLGINNITFGIDMDSYTTNTELFMVFLIATGNSSTTMSDVLADSSSMIAVYYTSISNPPIEDFTYYVRFDPRNSSNQPIGFQTFVSFTYYWRAPAPTYLPESVTISYRYANASAPGINKHYTGYKSTGWSTSSTGTTVAYGSVSQVSFTIPANTIPYGNSSDNYRGLKLYGVWEVALLNLQVYAGSTTKNVDSIYVNVPNNGVTSWRNVDSAYVYTNGQWRQSG